MVLSILFPVVSQCTRHPLWVGILQNVTPSARRSPSSSGMTGSSQDDFSRPGLMPWWITHLVTAPTNSPEVHLPPPDFHPWSRSLILVPPKWQKVTLTPNLPTSPKIKCFIPCIWGHEIKKYYETSVHLWSLRRWWPWMNPAKDLPSHIFKAEFNNTH